MNSGITKSTIEWEGHRITIEGPPEFVAVELERFRAPSNGPTTRQEPSGPNPRPMNDGGFVALKNPAGHQERIAVLAVRLAETGKAEFNAEDMRRAYLRAGLKPPKAMKQALVDTKRFKDYIEPTKTPGSYRLTDHGSDFVAFDLPRKKK